MAEHIFKKASEIFNGSMYIVFEGGDGAGKDTQIELLENFINEHLKSNKIAKKVIKTSEPGASERGIIIRNLLLSNKYGSLSPSAELDLFMADRREHFDKTIIPSLRSGEIIISSRGPFSSWVYQGYARGMNNDYKEYVPEGFSDYVTFRNFLATEYKKTAILPDLCFFLNIDPELGNSRIGNKDRLESETINFRNMVRKGYHILANNYPDTIKIIDAEKNIDEINNQILSEIMPYLKKLNPKSSGSD